MTLHHLILLLLPLFLLHLTPTHSLLTRWIGLAGDPHWSNPSNWYCADISRNCTPQATDDVVIIHPSSCSTCIKDIVIGPTYAAACYSLQLIGSSEFPLTLTVQSSLTIGAGGAKVSNDAHVIVIGDLSIAANFTSNGTFGCGGGRLFSPNFNGNFNLRSVEITSTCTFQHNTTISGDVIITPLEADLAYAIYSSTNLNILGKIICSYSLIVSGSISAGGLVFFPIKPLYSLNFQYGTQILNSVSLSGGRIQASGILQIKHLHLINNTNVFCISRITIANATGNGTIYVEYNGNANVKLYDTNVRIYMDQGSAVIGGHHGGQLEMWAGSVTIIGDNPDVPFLFERVFIYRGNVAGTAVQVRSLTFAGNTYIADIVFEAIETVAIGYDLGGFSFYLNSATFKIAPKAIVTQIQYLSITGYGRFIMDGTWTSNAFFTNDENVPLYGSGNWFFNNTAFNIRSPVNLTGIIRLVGSAMSTYPVPGPYQFNRILGDQNTQLSIYAETFTVKEVIVGNIYDYTSISTNIANVTANSYYIAVGGNRSIAAGSIKSLTLAQGYFQVNLYQVYVGRLTSLAGNTVAMTSLTNLVDFSFYGGRIVQLDSQGIFQVLNTTYLGTTAIKSIGANTVLSTDFLDCSSCYTPDCALGLSDWNHVRAKSSSGCIISDLT